MKRSDTRSSRAGSPVRRRGTRQRGGGLAPDKPGREDSPQAEEQEPSSGPQPTAVAAEAARTGVIPLEAQPEPKDDEIPGTEGETLRAGDPDVSALDNEYSGEEMPGASTPTPDQNRVDDIGKAYGVEEEDTGGLRPSSEILDRRDRRRR
jgi:uncharacterized protein DUF6335